MDTTRDTRPLQGTAAPCTCPRHGSETVRWLQGSLNRQRGLRLPVDGQMTPATRAALRDFQRARGLPADGAIGPPTQRALVEAGRAASAEPAVQGEWESEVSRSSAAYVMWVQSTLNRIAGAGLVVDGISGSLTKAAVKAFQSRSGLAVDGIVGPNTEAALLRAGATAPPGRVAAPTPAPAPATGPLARLQVPESEVLALLGAFIPYRYGTPVRYPHPLPGVSLPQGTQALTICCCFTEGLLVPAWAARHGSALKWDSTRHMDMMVRDDGVDTFSPMKAVISTGMATAVPTGQAPSAWCLAQGWRSFPSGHQFIVVARHAASDRVLTLEANTAGSGMDGVGCSGFGPLRNLPGQRPPARWWEDARAPTWSRLKAAYPGGIGLAQLAVTNPTWAGI